MSLLEDIKEKLQRKKQELEEERDELTGLIDFIQGLEDRLSDLEKELLSSSIDSVVRNGKQKEAQDMQEQIRKKKTELGEIREKIQTLQNTISLLEDQIS